MNNHFKCIGIVGHPRHPTALTTHEMLYRWLCTKGYEVIVEQQIAHELQLKNVKTGTLAEIGQQADLAVVVGGDGNMLGAARTLARYDIKVIGINRGNTGFLTDLDPDNAQQQLADVLEGHYISEKRFCWKRKSVSKIARNASARRLTKWYFIPQSSAYD